jgi:hypothetical protein
MTTRERKERRAERLEEWAAKRRRDASAVFKRNEPYTNDIAFNTQPGHIPARARIIAAEDRAFHSLNKAESMESRAEGIQTQLDRSVYSDDDNATEALEARAVKNEAKRDFYKAANKIIRSNPKNVLTEEKVTQLVATGVPESAARELFKPDFCGRIGFADYLLTNLGARIRTDRERIKTIQSQQQRTAQAESAPNGVTIEGAEYVRVTFAEKPEREILDALRAANFYWGHGSWSGKRESLPAEVKVLLEEVTA